RGSVAGAEASAARAYKQALVECSAKDISYTPYFAGVPGNSLRSSIEAAGVGPNAVPAAEPGSAEFGSGRRKAWKDIWGAGQGVGNIDAVQPVADIVAQLEREYRASLERLNDQFARQETPAQ